MQFLFACDFFLLRDDYPKRDTFELLGEQGPHRLDSNYVRHVEKVLSIFFLPTVDGWVQCPIDSTRIPMLGKYYSRPSDTSSSAHRRIDSNQSMA